jgi:cobalt-zinc-cadmium efflux system outer membrane protein
MTRSIHSIGVIAVLAVSFTARAETLLQGEVARTVLRENPSIKASRARWEAMKQRVPQVRAWEDPMAGVDVERMGTTRFDTWTDNEWMVSQQIPISGKNLSRGRAAEAEARASYEELRRVELDAVTRARAAYFRLANAHAQLEINRRNRELLSQFTDSSRVKYEAGTATQSDVLLAQTDLVRLDETRANLERDVVEQQSALNVLMNRPARSPLGRPMALAFKPSPIARENIEAIALANRPELLGADKRIDAAKAQLQLARRQWIPDPQIRVEARQFNGGGREIQEYDTGIFFNVPWVNFRKYSAGVAESRKSLESAERESEVARVEVLGLVRDQLKKIDTFARNYELFRDKIVPLARQAVDATRAGYEADKSGFLDVITSRRTFQDVESAMTEHLANHQVAVAELDAIIGGAPDASLRPSGADVSKTPKP